MSETHHTVKKIIDEGGSDFVSGAIDAAREGLSDLAENIQDRGEKLMKSAQHKGIQAWDEIQDRGEGAVKDLKVWIRRNPLPAVGWAFAAGAIVYALLRPNSD